jgi:hypothetical protein
MATSARSRSQRQPHSRIAIFKMFGVLAQFAKIAGFRWNYVVFSKSESYEPSTSD